jgi:hypothetical protein
MKVKLVKPSLQRLMAAPRLEALRAAIDEGDASGIAEGDVFEQVRETLHLAKISRASA